MGNHVGHDDPVLNLLDNKYQEREGPSGSQRPSGSQTQNVREREPLRSSNFRAQNADLSLIAAGIRRTRGGKPQVPRNLSEMAPMLNNYRPTNEIYQGSVNGMDNSSAYLFANNEMLREFSRENVIYLDTSDELAPRAPRMLSHLLMTIPVILCLCSHRSTELYRAISDFIKNRVPQLCDNLQLVVPSLEYSLVSSVRESFPFCHIRLTWMQVMRNFTRYWCFNQLPFRLNNQFPTRSG
ncbi:uncharacterized protein LOC103578476 [Microplitis demolitor]|uniref:uncharacterized protein LOC103578476 n=1 Tax=Microplitis demolitor TaxID=69319 RepID=UPI00235B668B|nr:uncharacterized protein LOC103578476 [Microplitis demolitor]